MKVQAHLTTWLLMITLAAPTVHAGPLFRAPSLVLDTRDMPLSVAMADFDSDSRQDLAVVVSGGVAVWRGNGDGTFRERTDFDTGSGPRWVAVADMNGDGSPDLVTANPGPYPDFKGSVSVLFGNGDGTFQPAAVYQAGQYALALTIADLNGDGHADVAETGYSIEVLLNRGDGTLGPATRLGAASAMAGPSPAAIGDLDGDGHPDLVLASGGAERDYPCPETCAISVFLGNGDGTFGPGAGFGTGNRGAVAAIEDFNRDGRPDVVFSNNYDRETTVSVLLGNGDGTLGGQRDFVADWSPYMVAVADVNADGQSDIVVTNVGDGDYHPNSVSILLGDGTGSFIKTANLPVRELPTSLAIGDLDGDGRLDLAVIGQYSNEVAILLGNGNGTFGTPEYATSGGSDEVAVADMNGDGRPDVLSATYNGMVSIRLGNGDGTLQGRSDFAAGSSAYDLAISDLNDDGFLDAVVAKAITSTISVHLGNGDGTLRPRTDLVTGGSPYSVAIEDLNGDGRKDLAVAKTALNTVAVMLGNGDGTFGGQTEFAVGGAPTTVAIRDFDRDGQPDLLTVNQATNSISVLRGRGDGTFGDRADHGIRGSPLMAAIGDLDGDGLLDLVLTKINGDSVSVLFGKGDGTFGVESDVRLWTSFVAIADFDRDGRSDLAALHEDYNAGSLSVLLGNGDGTFGGETRFGVGKNPTTLEACDLNGDGRMDLVVANASSNSISLLMGAASLSAPLKPRYAPGRRPFGDENIAAEVASDRNEPGAGGSPTATRLSLDGFRPNPAFGAPVVAFTLADGSPATIEVLDLAGRSMLRREVGVLGAGRHVASLGSNAHLAPGAYVMRLRQAGRTLTARGVVVR